MHPDMPVIQVSSSHSKNPSRKNDQNLKKFYFNLILIIKRLVTRFEAEAKKKSKFWYHMLLVLLGICRPHIRKSNKNWGSLFDNKLHYVSNGAKMLISLSHSYPKMNIFQRIDELTFYCDRIYR